jgi:hypothetical protein
MDQRRSLRALLLPLVLLLQNTHAQQPQLPNPLNNWMLSPWPYHCQPPVPLGQPCLEDYDCDASQAHHCHLTKRVCARGQPEGAPCNTGAGCGPGLGCQLRPPRMECFLTECTPDPADGSERCVQGASVGIPCAFDNATAACPHGSLCNVAAEDPSRGFGVCVPLPVVEGEECSSFNGHPQCGAGLHCLMGMGVCGKGGGRGQPCPILPDRCDITQGLTCISEAVAPFNSSCLPARGRGERCTSGGEWCVRACFG